MYVTRSTSMAKYKAIYGGEEYLIHFKYSDALNITYITMMYGMGIPLLFPVASLNLALTLYGERFACAFVVRQPPAMDDTMTKNTLRLLKLAPIILLMNGYWMISNKQIFNNVWTYLQEDTDTMPSSHVFGEFQINWATPLEAMAIASLFILVS